MIITHNGNIIMSDGFILNKVSSTPTPPSFASTNSFSFDGVDDFFLGTSTYSELNGTTKATWSIWLKPNLSGTGIISRVSTSTSSTAFVYQFVILASGEVIMQINDTTRRARTGTNYLTANIWSHILVCYDGTLANGSKTKMFINGVDSTSTDTTTSTSLNPANYSLQIGRRDFGTVINYGGLMDEFAVWSGTDLRANVNEIYNGGTPNDLNTLPTAPQPTTWQRMGEDSIWNGSTWSMTDVNGGYTNISTAMVEANRTTDVPPNPFVNLLSTSFDGIDDRVEINRTLGSGFAELSISTWVKYGNNLATSNQYHPIVAKIGPSFGNSFVLQNMRSGASSNGGELYFNVYTANGSFIVFSGVVPSQNVWYNIVGTYDGSNVKIYIDGVLKGTLSATGSINSNTELMMLGDAGYGGFSQFLNGNLDEVSIYSRGLTQSEVTSIFNGGLPNNVSTISDIEAYWRMGDGDTANTITDNVGSNDGTMVNMSSANFVTDVPTFNVYSTLFDGVDDYVEIGSPTSIQSLTSAITISAWIKAPRTFATNYYTLASKGEYAGVGSQWTIQINTANARNTAGGRFYVFPQANAITDNQDLVFPTPVDDNQWHHMMFVNDGTDLKVYIDGVLDATGAGKGRTLYDGNRSLRLGRLTASTTQKLIGNLDEVAIFGTALQLSDAEAIYNDGEPGDLTSLNPVSWWRFEEGSGSTATDSGSGGNNGTLINGVTRSTDVPT